MGYSLGGYSMEQKERQENTVYPKTEGRRTKEAKDRTPSNNRAVLSMVGTTGHCDHKHLKRD